MSVHYLHVWYQKRASDALALGLFMVVNCHASAQNKVEGLWKGSEWSNLLSLLLYKPSYIVSFKWVRKSMHTNELTMAVGRECIVPTPLLQQTPDGSSWFMRCKLSSS